MNIIAYHGSTLCVGGLHEGVFKSILMQSGPKPLEAWEFGGEASPLPQWIEPCSYTMPTQKVKVFTAILKGLIMQSLLFLALTLALTLALALALALPRD